MNRASIIRRAPGGQMSGRLRGLGAADSNPLSLAEVLKLPIFNFKPGNWENIDQFSYIAIGAINTTVTIITFRCPAGRNGIIHKIANNFVGAGWVEGSADIIWRILVDGTPPPGATNYDTILGSLGNPASPTEIDGFRIYENQVITLIAFNNPAGASGGIVPAGQKVGGRLVGYTYPKEEEDDSIWI